MNSASRRPLGVSLAVLASFVTFSLIPFLQVLLIWEVRQHFLNIGGVDGFPAVAVGSDVLGVSDVGLAAQGFLAAFFALIALFAWLGRPPFIRWLMSGTVCLFAVLQVVVTFIPAPPVSQGASSLDGIKGAVNVGELLMAALVALYVVWYLNRAPARAFYRGDTAG